MAHNNVNVCVKYPDLASTSIQAYWKQTESTTAVST